MKTKEIDVWVDIPEYEGLYKINKVGQIKRNERMLKTKINHKTGYCEICLSKNNKKKYYLVHRLLMIVYKKQPNGKDYVNHKNGIRADNRLENLEWVSCSENIKDGYNRNLHHRRVLTRKQASYVKAWIGEKSCAEIARELNVKPYIIYNIKYGKTYKKELSLTDD